MSAKDTPPKTEDILTSKGWTQKRGKKPKSRPEKGSRWVTVLIYAFGIPTVLITVSVVATAIGLVNTVPQTSTEKAGSEQAAGTQTKEGDAQETEAPPTPAQSPPGDRSSYSTVTPAKPGSSANCHTEALPYGQEIIHDDYMSQGETRPGMSGSSGFRQICDGVVRSEQLPRNEQTYVGTGRMDAERLAEQQAAEAQRAKEDAEYEQQKRADDANYRNARIRSCLSMVQGSAQAQCYNIR